MPNKPIAKHDGKPPSARLLAGIALSFTALPFALFILAAIARGEMPVVSEQVMSGALAMLLIGTTAHFFIGHRIRTLLPTMVGLLGASATVLGIVGQEWALVCGGGLFLGIAYDVWPRRDMRNSYFLRKVGANKDRQQGGPPR
jgi:hypothetical protein